MLVFKIRNGDGLFSDGKKEPRWNTVGKMWNSSKSIYRHIVEIDKSYDKKFYDGCYVYVYTIDLLYYADMPIREKICFSNDNKFVERKQKS